MLVWGKRERCELMSILSGVFALLSPPPPGAPAPAFAEPGVIESLMDKASLFPAGSGEFDCEFVYPDREIALQAIASAGIVVRAGRHLGEDKVLEAITSAFGPFTRADGSLRHTNRFRWVIAERP